MAPTSRPSIPSWARAGAICALGVALLGVVDPFDAPANAQVSDGVTTPLRPQFTLTIDASTPTDRAISISDDGRFVAFDTADDGSGELVVVDRVSATRLSDVPAVGAHPAISGDGCVIAFSDPDADALRIVDRCVAPVAEIDVLSGIPGGAALPAPAVSGDGSVVVWSTPGELLRFTRSGASYTEDTGFAPTKAQDRSFGPRLAMSSDGSSLAYETTADPDESDPTRTAVHLWTAAPPGGSAASAEVSPAARFPTMDATGDLLAYERRGAAGASAIEIHQRSASGGPAVIQTVDTAWKPALSSDGHHLVHQRADGVHVMWWSEASPFLTTSSVRVLDGTSTGDGTPVDSGPAAVVSSSGRVIVAAGDQSTAVADPPLSTGSYLWQHVRPQVVTAPTPVDLGAVTVGATAAGAVTWTNSGQVGIPLTRTDDAGTVTRFAPAAAAPLTASAWSCAGTDVWQPGVSCTQDVSIVPTAGGAARGTARLRIPADPATGAPVIDVTVTVTATGLVPSTTSTTTTTVPDTTVAPTTPGSTLPTGTVPVRTVFPLPSDPIFTGGSGSRGSGSFGSSSGRGSSSSTSGSSGTTTSTTIPELPTFEPPSFEFVPTIIDAGRRTTEIALVNPGPDPVTVAALEIAPTDGAFVLGATDCSDASLPSAGRCTIEVTFAPAAVGELMATLTATFADGRSATTTLSGLGADEPVLTVEPEVAANGQVVSVFGAGFPAGATVALSWDDGRITAEQVVTDVGDFSETFVVLPHTPRGPSELVVAGQEGLFADVTAELLVDVTARRADSAVFGKYNR